MKINYVFPGQGAQYEGMGKDLFESSVKAKSLFEKADNIVNFELSKIMFEGNAQDLKRTDVTQPAIFLNSIIRFLLSKKNLKVNAVAGHSLGEFTALVAAEVLSFEDGLNLIKIRANAMHEACELEKGTMAAILGLDDKLIVDTCNKIDGLVVPANFNCPGQLVISGKESAITEAITKFQELGAKRALILPVGGAFHSPLMKPAEEKLKSAILNTEFAKPLYPIYQNVTAKPEKEIDQIKTNLIAQLTAPVKWTQIMQHMIEDGMQKYVEVGASVLRGMMRKVDRKFPTDSI